VGVIFRYMEKLPTGHEEEVIIPPCIDDIWIEDFNSQYARILTGLRYTAHLEAENWSVQPAHEVGSSYNHLDDELGPHGNYRKIHGAVWDASITPRPQFINTANSPVFALLQAKLVMPDGTENLINENDSDYGLVLVRLDHVKDRRIKLINSVASKN
jgi:hypothetical protein